jgi:hypothetical protein
MGTVGRTLFKSTSPRLCRTVWLIALTEYQPAHQSHAKRIGQLPILELVSAHPDRRHPSCVDGLSPIWLTLRPAGKSRKTSEGNRGPPSG